MPPFFDEARFSVFSAETETLSIGEVPSREGYLETLPLRLDFGRPFNYVKMEFRLNAEALGAAALAFPPLYAASRISVNGVPVQTLGLFPPSFFLSSGQHVLLPIRESYFDGGSGCLVELELFTDEAFLDVTGPVLLSENEYFFVENVLDPMNGSVYRTYTLLCFFTAIFFLILYFQNRKDRYNLFFAFFSFFLGAYFWRVGNVLNALPFLLCTKIAWSSLFVAFLFLFLYCLDYIGALRWSYVVAAAVATGVTVFLLLVVPKSSMELQSWFSVSLILGLLFCFFAFLLLLKTLKHGQGEVVPVLAGGAVAIIVGFHDSIAFARFEYSSLWLNGLGAMAFLMGVYISVAKRMARYKKDYEERAKAIEAEVHRRTQELNVSNAALERANQAKSDFLAHMSHEMRTPLNCVVGFAQILQKQDLSVGQQHYTELILRESDRLLLLINQVLDVARIEKGKMEVVNEPFMLMEALLETIEEFSEMARLKGLQFEFLSEQGLPTWVLGDKLRLEQILINILGNAVKFTEKGFIRLEVDLDEPEARADGESLHVVKFRISDSGIGIEQDKISQVFSYFEQADTSIRRRYGGSGLGIAIAKELIKLMGGDIALESQKGIGTQVTFSVKFAMVDESGIDKASPPRGEPKFSVGKPGRTGQSVLIVEDYDPNREMLRTLLNETGLSIFEAASGREALSILERESSIELIFLDIHMPEMDGYETCRLIRSRWPDRVLTVVALTADAYSQTRDLCLEAGMNEVLTKPFRLEDLLATLRFFLDRPFEVEKSAGAGPNAGPVRPEKDAPDEIFDFDKLKRDFFDDEEIIEQLIGGFIRTTDALLPELAEMIDENKNNEVHLRAHAIKGGALNVRAQKLTDAALYLEEQSKKGDPLAMRNGFDTLKVEWTRFKAAWRDRLVV